MSAPASRRSFLRDLAKLPLVGGGVSLIGAPTAVAAPVTRPLLISYAEWLRVERNVLLWELYPGTDPATRAVIHGPLQANDPVEQFHAPSGMSWLDLPLASTRAALVLSTVGCGWGEGA